MKMFHKYLPLIAFVSGQDCGEDQRRVNGVCTDKCDLFKVTCSVDDGFSLEVDETCRAAQYSHLNLNSNSVGSFFIGNTDIQDDTSAVNTNDECKFSNAEYPTVLKNLHFTKCGGFAHSSPAGADYTVYDAFVNHRESLYGIVTSSMDQIEIQCRLKEVSVDTEDDQSNKGLSIAANDEDNAWQTLDSNNLIASLELGLTVGTVDGTNVFTELGNDDKIDVGSEVAVKLTKKAGSKFKFQLKGCTAYAVVDNLRTDVPLYDGFCPDGTASSIVDLGFDNYEQFSLNVFRIKNTDTITFACKVVVYPKDSTDLTDCNTSGRRRRSVDMVESVAVTKTITLEDQNSSSALQTCVNVLVPSLLFLTFL